MNAVDPKMHLPTFILWARRLEIRARAGASDAMRALLTLSPPRAVALGWRTCAHARLQRVALDALL